MSDSIDSYNTIAARSEGLFKDRGSKFLALAVPFTKTNDLDSLIQPLKKEHPKSRHHCFAYAIGQKRDLFRINDDGEPSGSAGKPIYGQILSHDLTDIIIIVTRYFGGTKLGVPGLINAYKLAAKEAIQNGTIVTKYLSQDFKLSFGYEHMGHALNVIKALDLDLKAKDFDVTPNVTLSIRRSKVEQELIRLKAKLLKKSEEEVAMLKSIPHYKIEAI